MPPTFQAKGQHNPKSPRGPSRPARFQQLLLSGKANSRGRPGYETSSIPKFDAFMKCRDAAAKIATKPFVDVGLLGPEVGEVMQKERLVMIKKVQIGGKKIRNH